MLLNYIVLYWYFIVYGTTLTRQNYFEMSFSYLKLWLHLYFLCDMAHPAGWCSQNPHLEVSSLSCVNINLATLMILPAATFTYHTPLWRGTWWRNRAETSVMLRLLLRLSVMLSHCTDQGNTVENTIVHCIVTFCSLWESTRCNRKLHTLNNIHLLMSQLCSHKKQKTGPD